MHSRYADWLAYVFDRPETPNGWYFDLEVEPFDGNLADIVELVALTMENCGVDLAKYSNTQVAHGLKYIFSCSCSDIVFALMDDSVAISLRLRAIASLKSLYRDCFTPRCDPALGHLSDPCENPLNYPCHMLWDFSPLSYWESRSNKYTFYGAVVDVLEDALLSPNPACVESALHGLGHIQSSYDDRVSQVITNYLKKNKNLLPALRAYAESAKVGNVQ